MINYKVTHTTTYIYSESVGLCYNIARLIPRTTSSQVCNNLQITINPTPDIINEYEDFFGNKLVYFAIQHEHKNLQVIVTSEIAKNDYNHILFDNNISWEQVKEQLDNDAASWIEARQYIPETAVTKADEEIKAYTLRSFTPGRLMFDAIHELMHRIYKDFTYKSGFTTIATPLSVVFKEKKGVCQDFAHLAIACIRAVGLPARYVSGYIETVVPAGQEKLIGTDASHAWFAVFIPGIGWVDFDPTNNIIPASQHITIGWGRDYFDIAPMKGVIFSTGSHELSVSVDMQRI